MLPFIRTTAAMEQTTSLFVAAIWSRVDDIIGMGETAAIDCWEPDKKGSRVAHILRREVCIDVDAS
jgi:hypothetical protein